jgi:diguanylate cyclase (GGDEF)-like protein/PAS domain S-box-containing protein
MNSTKLPGKKLARLRTKLRQLLQQEHKVWLTAIGVTTGVVLLRLTGMVQPVELAALDRLFQLRPMEPMDERIVIIGIDDDDINQVGEWPISDAVMAKLLSQVQSYQPRTIGLDLYRDLPVKPGHSELQAAFATTPNLVGIEKIADHEGVKIHPPKELAQRDQIGFNNVIVDGDGRVRRATLFWTVNKQPHTSFALTLALRYLKPEGIVPRHAAVNSQYMQLGQAVFRPFQANDGGYVGSDAGGYQILANFHNSPARFRTVFMRDVLAGRVDPNLFRDRIVLIGSTAASLKDFFYTPLSGGSFNSTQQMAGIELHANFISQILDAALHQRSLIRVWQEPWELLWIFSWAWAGAFLSWKIRSPGRSAVAVLLLAAGLTQICYLALLQGWWLPLVPPLMALVGSGLVIIGYLAHIEEELKKSKEFLNSVINTIPDPIFVKDRGHRWIVLNQAFCRFIGYPMEMLLEKSDHNFFPFKQATQFWKQDVLTFESGVEQETEEEFTDAHGATYLIATKRSLHKDAAGNLFLVGVIRDITKRKLMEAELRQTAEDLARSNKELRQTEYRLREMAYHDVLTGLPNRKLLYERLSQSIDQARTNGQLVALLFLDLDGFKKINDAHGHSIGDLLLKAVSQRLLGCLRGSDTVARLGGDEFVVLLPAISVVHDVVKVSEKIIYTLSQDFVLESKILRVTTSVGISLYPLDTQDMDNLITKADTAMYQAKRLGKNRCEFFHTEQLSSKLD